MEAKFYKKLNIMSHSIHLYRIETKELETESRDENFFENENNLEPFTPEQHEYLTQRLLAYEYTLSIENANGLQFEHSEYSIIAQLTARGLYFSAGFEGDRIFEAGMTASEFTDTGEFVKYDPQNNGWEEI